MSQLSSILRYFPLIFIVISSVISSYLTSLLQRSYSCNQPALFVYLGCVSFTLFLTPLLYALYRYQRLSIPSPHHHYQTVVLPSIPPTEHVTHRSSFNDWIRFHSIPIEKLWTGHSWGFWRRLLIICLPFSLLYFGANYLFSISLRYTDVSSALSIEQLSTLFTFILAVIFIAERLAFFKIIAICLSIAGGVLVGIGDRIAADNDNNHSHSSSFNNTLSSFPNRETELYFLVSSNNNSTSTSSKFPLAWVGDILDIGSALCAALYVILFSQLLHSPRSLLLNHSSTPSSNDDSSELIVSESDSPASSIDDRLSISPSVHLFTLIWLSFLGFIVFLLYWPLLIIFDITNFERFTCSSSKAIELIIIQCISTALFNICFALSLALFSPVLVRLVTICAVPSSFIASRYIVHTVDSFNDQQIIGSSLIVISFILFTISNSITTYLKKSVWRDYCIIKFLSYTKTYGRNRSQNDDDHDSDDI